MNCTPIRAKKRLFYTTLLLIMLAMSFLSADRRSHGCPRDSMSKMTATTGMEHWCQSRDPDCSLMYPNDHISSLWLPMTNIYHNVFAYMCPYHINAVSICLQKDHIHVLSPRFEWLPNIYRHYVNEFLSRIEMVNFLCNWKINRIVIVDINHAQCYNVVTNTIAEIVHFSSKTPFTEGQTSLSCYLIYFADCGTYGDMWTLILDAGRGSPILGGGRRRRTEHIDSMKMEDCMSQATLLISTPRGSRNPGWCRDKLLSLSYVTVYKYDGIHGAIPVPILWIKCQLHNVLVCCVKCEMNFPLSYVILNTHLITNVIFSYTRHSIYRTVPLPVVWQCYSFLCIICDIHFPRSHITHNNQHVNYVKQVTVRYLYVEQTGIYSHAHLHEGHVYDTNVLVGKRSDIFECNRISMQIELLWYSIFITEDDEDTYGHVHPNFDDDGRRLHMSHIATSQGEVQASQLLLKSGFRNCWVLILWWPSQYHMRYVFYDLYLCTNCISIFPCIMGRISNSPGTQRIYNVDTDSMVFYMVIALVCDNIKFSLQSMDCSIKRTLKVVIVYVHKLRIYCVILISNVCLQFKPEETIYSIHTVDDGNLESHNFVYVVDSVRLVSLMRSHVKWNIKSAINLFIDRHNSILEPRLLYDADGKLQRSGTHAVLRIIPRAVINSNPGHFKMSHETWMIAALVRVVHPALEGLRLSNVWWLPDSITSVLRNMKWCFDNTQVCMRRYQLWCVLCLCLDWVNALFKVPISRLSTGLTPYYHASDRSYVVNMCARPTPHIYVQVSSSTIKRRTPISYTAYQRFALHGRIPMYNTALYCTYMGVYLIVFVYLVFLFIMYMMMMYSLNPLHE